MQLEINKAIFSFIYSFLPVAGEMTYDKDVLELLLNSRIKSSINIYSGKPNEKDSIFLSRNGLSTYLDLDFDNSMGCEILSTIDTKIIEIDLPVKIYPIFRYCSFGASLTFSVVIEKSNDEEYLDLSKLYKVMQIVSTVNNDKSKYTFASNCGDNLRLYELFEKLVNDKINQTNYSVYSSYIEKEFPEITVEELPVQSWLENCSYSNIEEITTKIITFLNDNSIIKDNLYNKIFSFIKNNHVNLFCNKYLINDTTKEVKTPWVNIAFEINKESNAYKVFCGTYYPDENKKDSADKKLCGIYHYEKQIAPFLYRAIDPELNDFQLEPCYDNFIEQKRPLGFENMYLDARLYIHMSRRSILQITDKFCNNPGNYIMPTLLDLSELIYTKWQSLLFLNRMLDDELKKFSNKKDDIYFQSEKINRLIQLMKKSVTSLDDPTSYIISGDSMKEMYDMLRSTFKITELQTLANKKCDMLEQLYNLEIKK